MRHMHGEGFGVKRIASAIGCSTDTASKHVFKKYLKKAPKGGPLAIGPATYKKVEKVYQKMLRECKGQEVIVAMVKARMKLKCSVKSSSRAFWQHGVYFRPLYEQPDLSPEGIRSCVCPCWLAPPTLGNPLLHCPSTTSLVSAAFFTNQHCIRPSHS